MFWIQKHWVVGGATSNGAGIFDWAGHTFLQEVVQSAKRKGENPYDALLSAIAFVPAGANGLIFHPYLLGERSTALGRRCVWQFYRFTAATYRKRNDEGDSRRDLSQSLSDFKKEVCQENQLTEIRATGGFAQSPIFRQMMADVLGYPLVFPYCHRSIRIRSCDFRLAKHRKDPKYQ